MKYYFTLQRQLLVRKSHELGLNPLLGLFLVLACGIVLPFFLTPIAPRSGWILVVMAAWLVLQNSRRDKFDFLQLQFGRRRAHTLLALENGGLILPILSFLVIQLLWFQALFLAVIIALFSWMPLRPLVQKAIPTPYSRHPFEFAAGFRRSWWIYLGLTVWIIHGWSIGNGNLAFVGICLITLTQLANYLLPEDEVFIWNFAYTPSQFLWAKIRRAVGQQLYLSIPFFAGHIVCFPDRAWLLLLLLVVGTTLFALLISMKYARFPLELSVVEAVFFCTCIFFPPLLLVFVPMYFQRACRNLENWLTND